MSEKPRKATPSFKGLTWHREQFYSFFIPIDWHKATWPDERDGVLYVPSDNDPHTTFAVEVNDLGTVVTPDDIPYLSKGFLDGIKRLSERKIESQGAKVTGELIELTAKYTFLEDDNRRKRWVRVFYHETRQITVTAQGATEESYDYWLPMFFEAMMTLKVHSVRPEDIP